MPEAVDRLRHQTLDQNLYEIIIVDNNPSDKIREFVESYHGTPGPEVRYVPEPRTGLHYGRHTGAKAARSGIVVYIDDDVIAQPDWLDSIIQEFNNPQVGMVGGKVLLQFETLPPEWVKRLDLNGYLSMFDRGDEPFNFEPKDSLVGANCAIRQSLLYEVGGFNPDGMGSPSTPLIWLRGDGETGLTRKVQKAGWIVRYTPRAVVYHQINTSRCTIDYMLTRAFTNGISCSFTYFRYRRISPYWIMRFMIKRVYEWVRSIGRGKINKLNRKFNITGMKYGFRLVFSSHLRSHVIRSTFLDEQDWPNGQ